MVIGMFDDFSKFYSTFDGRLHFKKVIKYAKNSAKIEEKSCSTYLKTRITITYIIYYLQFFKNFQVDCQNYIRVLAKTEDDRLLVCGTNAYDPRCRYYSHNETHTSVDQEFSGKGFCPYDPRHNSTFLYTGKY